MQRIPRRKHFDQTAKRKSPRWVGRIGLMRGALSRDGKKSRSGQERPHRKVVIAPLCDKALTGSPLGSLKERRLGRGFELLRSQAINKYGETIWLDSNAFREGSLERGSPWPNSVCNSSRLHMAPGPKPRRAFHTANRNAHELKIICFYG